MTATPPESQRPSLGHLTQLDRITRVAWALVGERDATGGQLDAPVVCRLVECGSGKEIHTITAKMVEGLLAAGWIEPDGTGDARRWGY